MPTGSPAFALSAGGVITGTPTALGSFTFTVRVTDSAAATTTKDFTINVMAAVDITTSATLPAATVGAPYSTVLVASGGTPPYTWASSPPFGLTMSASTGAITGTPTTSGGPTTFTVQLTDFSNYMTSETFSLTVNSAPTPNITTTTLPNALAGADYTQQLFKSGGSASDVWSLTFVSGNPMWFTVSTTGLLTGPAPATPLGATVFNAQLKDTAGAVLDTQQLSVTVSSTAQQPTTPNPNVDDDDDKFHGKCNAFFSGSEMGRKNKMKSAAFQQLIVRAGAQQEFASFESARAALEAKVRTFCNNQSGFWHWHPGSSSSTSASVDIDDDDDHEDKNKSSNQAKIKGQSSGKNRKD